MTTEHDEGFKAGIEAAATLVESTYGPMPPYLALRIRNLKPAPRSAEQSERKDAQTVFAEALRVIEAKDTSANGEYGYFACIARAALNKGAPAKGE